MTNVRVNTVMEKGLLQEVDAYARERREDRSTAIRQLVAFALRETRVRQAIDKVRVGQMTLREFAHTVGLDIWQAHDLLAASGVPIGSGSMDETAGDLAQVLGRSEPKRGRVT